MSHHESDASLTQEAASWRRKLRFEQAQHAQTRAVLEEANRTLLAVYLRERLADPRDFEVYVGFAAVLAPMGGIVWTKVDLFLAELLAAKPYLATPRKAPPEQHVSSAVEWLSTGT